MTATLRLNAVTPRAAIPATATTLIYVRVSSDDQATADKASLPEQERLCREFLATKRRTADAHVWSDAGISGRDTLRLERLASWCEVHPKPKGARGLIVALKRDRWERFVHDANAAAYYEYRMARAGWDVDFALEAKTGNRIADAALAVVHGGGAAAESEEKSRRAYMGRKRIAEAGGWAGRPPFGYDRTVGGRVLAPGEGAGGALVKLAPNADAATVKLIFRRFTAGATLREIADELHEAGKPGPWDRYPNGATRWGAAPLRAILSNRAYIGETAAMRRHNSGEKRAPIRRGTQDMQDVRVVLPEAERIVRKGTHAALIDARAFAAAQDRLHPWGGLARKASEDYWLSGLLICRECGSPLVGGGGRGTNRCYRCAGGVDDGHHGGVRCKPPLLTVNKLVVEHTVIERLAASLDELVRSGKLAAAVERALGGSTASERRSAATLDKDEAKLTAARRRVIDAVADGTLARGDVKDKLAQLDGQLAALQADRAALRLVPAPDRKREVARLVAQASNLAGKPPAVQRQFVATWLEKAVIGKPARKGGPLPVELVLHYPGEGQAHPGAARRCWRAASPPSCRR